MSEFRDQPKRSISLRQLTVSKIALLISKNRTPHIQEPLPVSLSNDILKSLKSQSSLNSTTLSLLNNEKFTITEADLSLCKISLRSLSIVLKHKLRFLSLFDADVEKSEKDSDNEYDLHNVIETVPLISPTLVYLNTSCFQYPNLFTEFMKGHYNELRTEDLNEMLRSIERIGKIIPTWEESIRKHASNIVQVMCSQNVFRLEPQLLSRCLTVIDYTTNDEYLLKLRNLVKIKDLIDYCVLDYESYCRAAFKYRPSDNINEPCAARSDILTALVPKLTLVTMNSLMDDIHKVIARLTFFFGKAKIGYEYEAIIGNMLTIIVAVIGHSEDVCVRLSARYPLQYMLCQFLRKAKSYSTNFVECIVQILNNMTALIDRISPRIYEEMITVLVSTVSEDRLESLITRGVIEKEYDDDMIDKAILSLICSLIQSSKIIADRLTIAATQRRNRI